MHEQQNKQSRPEVTAYGADEIARRVYFQRSSGEVQTGTVTGEANVDGRTYYEVAFVAEDGAIATKLIGQEALDNFDTAERERRVSDRTQNMGDIALRAPVAAIDRHAYEEHDPSSNAIPMAEVRKLMEEAGLADGSQAQQPLIEVPEAWRKPRGE